MGKALHISSGAQVAEKRDSSSPRRGQRWLWLVEAGLGVAAVWLGTPRALRAGRLRRRAPARRPTPALRTVQRLADQLGAGRAEQMQHAFADRMNRIASRENQDARPDEIDSLIARYGQTSELRERDRLWRRYMAAVGKLGWRDRVRELGRLQTFIE